MTTTMTTEHGTALPPDYYLPDADYRRLVGKLQRLVTSDHEGAPRDLPSEIMEALGEHAGIWPESVRDDPLAEVASSAAALRSSVHRLGDMLETVLLANAEFAHMAEQERAA